MRGHSVDLGYSLSEMTGRFTVVDAVISSSGPTQWKILEKPGDTPLGMIIQSGTDFAVAAFKDNFLTGISLGPYASKEEAMTAIAEKIGGDCSVV
jgi:hypothetical protein